jgi:hypothetical protein
MLNLLVSEIFFTVWFIDFEAGEVPPVFDLRARGAFLDRK